MLRTSVPAPNPFQRKIRPLRQKGYLLIELGLVLIVSTMMLAGQFSKIINTINQLNADSTAEYLKEVQAGTNRYIEENLQSLKTGNAIAAFPTPLQPTIAQLQNPSFKYIDARLPATTALELSVNIVLTRATACNTSADDTACDISGLAHSTAGYQQEGQLRSDVLAIAVSAIGKDGAMSYAESVTLLRFEGGTTFANPVPNTPGILAIRVGNHSGLTALLNPYYRLDGSKKLTGPMDANSQDITNVLNLKVDSRLTTQDITVNGALNMAGGGAGPGTACGADPIVRKTSSGNALVICSGGTWQLIGSAVSGIGEGASCSSPGQIGSSSTGVSYICNGSVYSSVNTTAALNSSCAPDGRLAMTVDSVQLVCKNGAYVTLLNLLNKSVEVSRVLITDGMTVNKPACEAFGTASYSFQLTQTVVDVAVTPPRQAMFVAATDIGPSWSIRMKVKDNTGAEFSANNYSVSAVMKLECAY